MKIPASIHPFTVTAYRHHGCNELEPTPDDLGSAVQPFTLTSTGNVESPGENMQTSRSKARLAPYNLNILLCFY